MNLPASRATIILPIHPPLRNAIFKKPMPTNQQLGLIHPTLRNLLQANHTLIILFIQSDGLPRPGVDDGVVGLRLDVVGLHVLAPGGVQHLQGEGVGGLDRLGDFRPARVPDVGHRVGAVAGQRL